MPRRILHRAAASLDELHDRIPSRPAGRIVIVPYRGYGRDRELFVSGRVIADKRITRATEAEPLWQNLVNSYRRFQSDEIAGATVVARYRDVVVETKSDAEGYFRAELRPADVDRTMLWHEVTTELASGGASAVAHVLVPPLDAAFGIVSDIDDTIVQTGATSLRRMIRSVLLANAATRLPFDGVADFYRALYRDKNPLFYVSSSPWNLYDLLHDFLEINRIPHGPLMLQDWGIDSDTLITDSHTTHKLAAIQRLLDYYPALRFVLIGDSGQHDPEIYLQVVQANPGRIVAIFIRDVTADLRDQAVARLIEQTKAAGVEMLYVRDSAEATTHAKRLGLL